jgi:hypothetical protein
MAEAVECLPSMCEVLDFISSITKRKKKMQVWWYMPVNPRYSGGRRQEGCQFKPSPGKVNKTLSQKQAGSYKIKTEK